jgi:hypothetical protein
LVKSPDESSAVDTKHIIRRSRETVAGCPCLKKGLHSSYRLPFCLEEETAAFLQGSRRETVYRKYPIPG